MSRIRTVKPELFKHEALFDAEQNSKLPLRLAFIGLLTVVDCEGRFKWRPRTIKLEVLPHDLIDFASVLNALESGGFIQRYEVDGESYGWIPTFTKHQRLQTKELTAGSLLPAPSGHDEHGTNQGRTQMRSGTHPEAQEGKRKGKEGRKKRRKRRTRTRPRLRLRESNRNPLQPQRPPQQPLQKPVSPTSSKRSGVNTPNALAATRRTPL